MEVVFGLVVSVVVDLVVRVVVLGLSSSDIKAGKALRRTVLKIDDGLVFSVVEVVIDFVVVRVVVVDVVVVGVVVVVVVVVGVVVVDIVVVGVVVVDVVNSVVEVELKVLEIFSISILVVSTFLGTPAPRGLSSPVVSVDSKSCEFSHSCDVLEYALLPDVNDSL